ncbi:MAG TPA: ATP cone domain-containing protein [Candidatus Nitrosocosmicus sp.]
MNSSDSEQVNINVEKRNGSHETFDKEKLARGVSRSGIPFMMAKDIAESIYKKIKENNDNNNNNILSSQIKEFVIEDLKSRNENVITESYSGYSKNTITELSANHKYDSKASPAHISHKKDYVK